MMFQKPLKSECFHPKGKTPSQIPKSILIDTGFGTCVENQNILKKINNIFDNKDDPFRK